MRNILKKLLSGIILPVHFLQYLYTLSFLYRNKYETRLVGEDKHSWELSLLSILTPLLKQFSKENSVINIPAYRYSISGKWSDQFEAFSRSFLGFSFLYSTYNKENFNESEQKLIEDLLEKYLQGIHIGTNPNHSYYWGNIPAHQKHCESGLIALGISILETKRDFSLPYTLKQQTISWFEKSITARYKKNNWLWFKLWQLLYIYKHTQKKRNIILKTFTEIENLRQKETAWYRDNENSNEIYTDHYNGWTFHFYNLLFIKLYGADFPEITLKLKELSHSFLIDYEKFFSIHNGPVPYGRSLTYRFAHMAPFGAGIINDIRDINNIKQKAIGTINYFLQLETFLKNGFISIGYKNAKKNTVEKYSGSGSPYWCLKGFSFLLIPETDIFWKKRNIETEDLNNHVISNYCGIISRNKNEQILFLNGSSIRNRYPYNYNKFVYSNTHGFNAETTSPDNNLLLKFDSDRDWDFRGIVQEHKTDTFRVKTNWKSYTDKFTIQTTITPEETGYRITHAITSIKKGFIVLCGGFPISARDIIQTTTTNQYMELKGNTYSKIEILTAPTDATIKYTTYKSNKHLFYPQSTTPTLHIHTTKNNLVFTVKVTNTTL